MFEHQYRKPSYVPGSFCFFCNCEEFQKVGATVGRMIKEFIEKSKCGWAITKVGSYQTE
jgi:hypothetical protein